MLPRGVLRNQWQMLERVRPPLYADGGMATTPINGGPRPRPFLKWAGGKARSAKSLVSLAPPFNGCYREPFMGSAAVFFELSPEKAVLSDANEELVVCFREVARDPFEVMDLLDSMQNTRSFYEKVRDQDPSTLSDAERAARVIYLNKTGFRGLWRVNRSGKFNVPYGEYARPYYNRDNLMRVSKALADAEVLHADFEDALSHALRGDWVYLDPPYVPDRRWGDFKRYTRDQFGAEDHERLAEGATRAANRGVFVMLTNSNTRFVRDLYAGWEVRALPTRRDISLKAADRRSVDLVITNYTDFAAPTLLEESAG